MRQQQRKTRCAARPLTLALAALGIAAISAGAIADRPNAIVKESHNMNWLGHNDLQGRTAYQPTLQTYPNGKVYAFVGHFAGTMFNPITGVNETNGTSIVDVTQPTAPKYVKHIPGAGSQMVRVCNGTTGVLGTTGQVYMLRNNGSGGGNGKQEVWNVTDPTSPVLLSTPVTNTTATHKSYWECDTGVAYIVAGQNPLTGSATPDGWFATGSDQHIKVFDLIDPAHPIYIRDYGLVGQNHPPPNPSAPSGIHGPISVTTLFGTVHNRVYGAYGVGANGNIQVVDRQKLLPALSNGRGGAWCPGWAPNGLLNGCPSEDGQHPTDAQVAAAQIGLMTMSPNEGGHTSWPIYGIPLQDFQGFTSNTTRDILAITSEETGNKCAGSPHFTYLADITSTVAAGAATGASAEKHPMVISTITVGQSQGNPDFCTRGTRFGVHSTSEAFYEPYYGKLLITAWFDAGVRVHDIRDPFHPLEVAYFIPPLNANIQPTTVGGVNYFDVSTDNAETDDHGLIYIVDRVGGGLDILQLNGCAKQIVDSNGSCNGNGN